MPPCPAQSASGLGFRTLYGNHEKESIHWRRGGLYYEHALDLARMQDMYLYVLCE
jgi:hypothetical protein